MIFDTSNGDLISALAYLLRGHGHNYEFKFDEFDKIKGLEIYNDSGHLLVSYEPGDLVDPAWIS